MDQTATVQKLLFNDQLRRVALQAVAALRLPDCWIGSGFVRDAVWDHLHGYGTRPPHGDVDVIWMANETSDEIIDRTIENELLNRLPNLRWSVKNQARMHLRNGNASYVSVADAMRHWPETATAIAARIGDTGYVEINAPFGTDDLFNLRLRPTPEFWGNKLSIFENRVSSKNWIERYPRLRKTFAATAAISDS